MSYSDVEIFVLNGLMTVGDTTCVAGHYFFIPAGVATGAVNVPQGCEALVMYNDSEPSFIESDSNHPLANTEGFISVNSYEDMPWASGSIESPRLSGSASSRVSAPCVMIVTSVKVTLMSSKMA